jgi:hypothetical protein
MRESLRACSFAAEGLTAKEYIALSGVSTTTSAARDRTLAEIA